METEVYHIDIVVKEVSLVLIFMAGIAYLIHHSMQRHFLQFPAQVMETSSLLVYVVICVQNTAQVEGISNSSLLDQILFHLLGVNG